jgi:two-component system alkaline phosphatase synthesis response regulator PhoP
MPLKVLVVDDEESLRMLVAQFFKERGYIVVTAEDGESGLQMALQERPDIVILDLMMPGMLGFEVCKRIRQDSSFAHTVVIITSAKSYKPDIEMAMELGADAFVVKPADVDYLMTLATDLHAQRAQAS